MSKLILIFVLFTVCSCKEKKKETKKHKKEPATMAEALTLLQGLKGPAECQFPCPDDADPTPDNKHVPVIDGCDAKGIKMEVEIYPIFESCCDSHDKCYQICNKKKKDCDIEFKKCLMSKCDRYYKYATDENDDCREEASGVFSKIEGPPCANYQEFQRHACLCNGKTLSKKKLQELTEDKKEKGEL